MASKTFVDITNLGSKMVRTRGLCLLCRLCLRLCHCSVSAMSVGSEGCVHRVGVV